jgi:hypothetical protein
LLCNKTIGIFVYSKDHEIMEDKIRNLIAQYLNEISKSKIKLQNYASLDFLTDEIINEELALQAELNDRVEKLRIILKKT